ncbi:MAG: hemolysin III family protein [Eubacterium sp.]|nr:hemolysin III family protein [Eubacterium sp.]
MKRTKLADRKLPDYTRGEEIFNMVSHIVGGGFGVIALGLCAGFSIYHKNWWGLGGGIFYGLMMIYLYTISSVYHGLIPEKPKKVMQVLDHCTIFALIFGTYVPVLLTGIRENYIVLFWITLAILVVSTAVCVTFTAIDFKKYAVIANIGYFGIGWASLLLLYPMYKVYGLEFVLWIFFGGVSYTVGIIFFILQKKKRYMHSIFHLFILLGSVLHFIPILTYCM